MCRTTVVDKGQTQDKFTRLGKLHVGGHDVVRRVVGRDKFDLVQEMLWLCATEWGRNWSKGAQLKMERCEHEP